MLGKYCFSFTEPQRERGKYFVLSSVRLYVFMAGFFFHSSNYDFTTVSIKCKSCFCQRKGPLLIKRFLFVFFLFFLFLFLFIYLFIYGCIGSSFLCEGFLLLRQVGATLHRDARASHHRGLSRCGAQAPDAQAQQLWLTGPAAPRHVGSSQTRARTRVPCIGRQTLNHCTTREAQ